MPRLAVGVIGGDSLDQQGTPLDEVHFQPLELYVYLAHGDGGVDRFQCVAFARAVKGASPVKMSGGRHRHGVLARAHEKAKDVIAAAFLGIVEHFALPVIEYELQRVRARPVARQHTG